MGNSNSSWFKKGLNGLVLLSLVRDCFVYIPRSKKWDRFIKLLTFVRIYNLWQKRKVFSALIYTLNLFKFQINDSDYLSVFQHLTIYLRYGMLGPRFPPSGLKAMARARHESMWSRHRGELYAAKEVAPIWSVRGPERVFVWVCSPDLIKDVLLNKDSFPTRGDTGFTNLTELGLLGLPTGKMHSKHRKVVGGFMSQKWLNQYAVFIQEETHVLIEKWKQSTQLSLPIQETNATYDLSMLTLEVIMKVCFGNNGEDINQQLVPQEENIMNQALDRALKEITLGTAIPFYKYLPSPSRWTYFKRYEKMFERAASQCVEISKNSDAPLMMYSALLEARNDDGTPWSEKEIFDEMNTVRGAGHETTSNTLSWAMYLLIRHPRALKKLQDEVDRFVEGESVSFEESKQLKFTHMIIWETLRLYPTVPSFPREAAKNVKLGGYDVVSMIRAFYSHLFDRI